MQRCELCLRETPQLTEHHLKPRSQLKKGETSPMLSICPACHRQLHVLFTLDELAREYNSLERLRDEPRMQRFLSWVRKQDAHKAIRVRKKR